MNNYEMSPLEDKKDYSFLFQKPEEYQIKVDEEGNYLTDLDSFEIPETAFDSGEDITSTFMGNDSVEFPYIIGSAMEDKDEMEFKMPEHPYYPKSTMETPSVTDTYIPDAEHVLDFEPSYRDYLDTEIEEYNSDFGNETDFVSKPNSEVMENPSFNYNDYYDVENEDTFEYSDKMKSSEYEEEDEDEEDFEYEEEEESDEDEENEDDEEESEEYDEDEESDEDEEEVSEKMNKEVKEAISYLETYSSVTNKNLSLQEKVRCLSEAGYNKTIINYIVSNDKAKHKSIKEINKTPRLNKFIEKNNSKLLEKLYKEHKFSLKEQKLFEGLTELNKHILKQTPILLNLMTTRNPTFEGLADQPTKQEALKERFNLINNMLTMIPSLYTIAMASFMADEESQKATPAPSTEETPPAPAKEKYSLKNRKNRFKEQDPNPQEDAKIKNSNELWSKCVIAINQFNNIVNQNTEKAIAQVGALKKIKGLVTKVNKGARSLFGKAMAKARELKKSWDDLDTEDKGTTVAGKPVDTSKI